VNSTVEKLNETKVKLTIEVPFVELQPHVNHAYTLFSEKVSIPGFRKGKVPRAMIDQKVGRAAVVDEAINNSMSGFYSFALKEHNLAVMNRPKVEITEFIDNEKLTFTAEVEVRPEISLPDFSKIEIVVDDIEIADSEVDEQVEVLRQRFGKLNTLENTPAKKGLFVSIDLEATIDGKEIEGGTAKSISYEVGSNSMIDGLDDALEGLNVGESKTFDTKLVGQAEGEKGEVKVTLQAVKERELPPLDAEFVKKASEFETLEELKADLKSRIERVKRLDQASQARDLLVEKILKEENIPVPTSIVEDEVTQHLESEGRQNDEAHKKEVTDQLIEQLKREILFDTIVSAENITPNDDELTQYIYRASANYGMNPDDFIKEISNAGQVNSMVAEVSRAKALAAIISRVKVVTKSGKVVDIESLNKTPEQTAAN
jgi:trigger factor